MFRFFANICAILTSGVMKQVGESVMPKRTYTTEEKAHALAALSQNGGDTLRTSLQMGIPERTLYTWSRRWRAENQQQSFSELPPLNTPPVGFENDLNTLAYLRRQIMAELVNLASNFQAGMGFVTPYRRVRVLSQLLDKLMQLDIHLQPYTPVEAGYDPY
jgi:transposase-like protein